jgi:hypothetical protein
LPPRWNIIAPAVAASGLPVMAIQCWPCSGGFCVFAIERTNAGDAVCAEALGTPARPMQSTLLANRAARALRGEVRCGLVIIGQSLVAAAA